MINSSDKKFLSIILFILLCIYFAMPPRNKIAQWGYIINNIQLCINNEETEEYVFHRNNAIYLTKMNNQNSALREIDKAISSLPPIVSDKVLYGLYRDRAHIRMYYGDYKGALNDYLRLPNNSITDYLTLAMLLKENGKKNMAVSYCNRIIDIDIKAYAGYACIADIYASANKYEAAIAIYDLLIDRSPNKAKYYADRAMYKEKYGDIEGSKADYKKASELSPFVDYNASITYDAIHPKKICFSVCQSSQSINQ